MLQLISTHVKPDSGPSHAWLEIPPYITSIATLRAEKPTPNSQLQVVKVLVTFGKKERIVIGEQISIDFFFFCSTKNFLTSKFERQFQNKRIQFFKFNFFFSKLI